MTKRKQGLPIVLAATVAAGTFLAAPQAYAIRGLDVDAKTDQAGEESKYTIRFELEEDLDRGETITIRFEDDFDVDERIDERDVEVNGKRARSVDVDDNVIEIEVPEDLEDGDDVTVEILDGITNPDDEGKFYVKVRTEHESWETFNVKIVDEDEEFSVSLNDAKAGAKTSYILGKFDLKSGDKLKKGKTITVTFPDAKMLPTKINRDDVRVNGHGAANVAVDKRKVEIEIPSGADGDDELKIEFRQAAGIQNPDKKGSYTIEIAYDGEEYESKSFTIKEGSGSSSGSNFAVSLSNSTVGANASYSFEVDLGSKQLSYNRQIQVEFPANGMVPAYIAPGSVSINGTPASNVWVNGNQVNIMTPYGFSPASKVNVVFSPSANLVNPRTAGDYRLTVKLADSTFTSQPFTIGGTLNTGPNGGVDNSTATISLSNPALNAPTAITVQIRGLSAPLGRGQDFLELALPAGFTVPGTIQPAHVTVNGLAAAYVATRGQNVVIYPAQDLYPNTAVNLVIGEAANIKTPATAQAYSIGVYSSEEREPLFIRAVGVGGVVVQPTVPADAAHLRLDVASFTKNGQSYPLAAAPYTVNGNTLVPAQFFRDALGLSTQWNNQTAVIISGTTVISFTVGEDTAQIGQTTVKLKVAVQEKNGMPMLPIRFIADTLKYTLGWDGTTSSIVMYK